MLLAAFEPGKEMAIANFFLAIFCLFTFALPLLLITRGDKTEANRNFLAATVNPWSQVVDKAELASVIVSEITPSVTPEPNWELLPEESADVLELNDLSLEIRVGDDLGETATQELTADDELLVA
tara:strand:+ start:411 stop:785 length:375 start_codon:yes stop_codon:yes gene_type:complete